MLSRLGTSDPDSLLNETQAAQLLNLSTRTLQAWRISGRGPPFVRAGRAVRYLRRALMAWIEAHTVLVERAPIIHIRD
jgi:excisionase family DNA binding protein